MTAPNDLNFSKDAVGQCAYAPDFPLISQSCSLPAAGRTTITIPSDVQNWVIAIGYVSNAEVWVARNTSAQPPSQSTLQPTNSIVNLAQAKVYGGDIIEFYNNGSATTNLSVALYARP